MAISGKLSTVERGEPTTLTGAGKCEVVSPVMDHGEKQITDGHGGAGVIADAGYKLRCTLDGGRCQDTSSARTSAGWPRHDRPVRRLRVSA